MQKSERDREKVQRENEKALPYLDRHGPQVGAEEEEPHQLVGFYGDEVVNLPQGHLPHGHVGGGQPQDLVVDHGLEVDENTGNHVLCLWTDRPDQSKGYGAFNGSHVCYEE